MQSIGEFQPHFTLYRAALAALTRGVWLKAQSWQKNCWRRFISLETKLNVLNLVARIRMITRLLYKHIAMLNRWTAMKRGGRGLASIGQRRGEIYATRFVHDIGVCA